MAERRHRARSRRPWRGSGRRTRPPASEPRISSTSSGQVMLTRETYPAPIHFGHGCRARRQSARTQWLEEVYSHAGRARGAVRDHLRAHEVKPLYTAEDLADYDPERDLGFPGEHPYTRGVYPSMYRGRLWTMRQFAGFGTAEETNERFRYLLDHGQTGLSTAFDMPTLMGLDSDHGRSLGEVGRRGGGDRHPRRHDRPLRRHPARPGDDLDDDQRPGGDPARLLRLRRRGAGHPAGGARRHDPDRHPQGVHRPEGVVLPDRAGDAAGHRHGRVVRRADAALAPDLDLRLPHPRGRLDRAAGARLHAQGRVHLRRGGARARPRRRRLRAAPLVLLQRPHRLLRGDREVPRRAADLGARDARHLRRPGREESCGCASTPRPRASR